MSFPRYPTYKPSGVEWLGEVPGHWEVSPLRRSLAAIEQGWSPDCHSRPAELHEWGVLKSGCTNGGTFNENENKALPTELGPLPELEVSAGDVLMSRASGSPALVGSVALVRSTRPKLMLSDKVYRLRLRPHVEAGFLVHALASALLRAQIERAISGAEGLANNIPQSAVRSFALALPPLPEQHAIAAFLDRETARIDALVAEQERLIELLREKRQAVISHAVTKGLDPSVPMKDSGVEWLGAVPAHWEVGPLKRYWTVTDCKHVTAEFVDDGIPLASIREVQARWVDLSEAKATTDHFYRLLIEGGREPRAGDLVFSRNATVGEVAEVPVEHPRFAMGQDVVLLRKISDEGCSGFMLQLLRSRVIETQLSLLMIGSTFKRINVQEIRNLTVPWPPAEEQIRILNEADRHTTRLDALTTEAERAIVLLQERRAALISAAVTGQIDVRGLGPEVTA